MEKRFGVISADGHCRLMHLPFDLWTKRLPRKFQDDGPRVVEGPDGTRQWVVEGRPWSGVGWAGVGRGPVNCYTRFGLPTGVIFDWVGAPEPVLHQMWEPVWAAAAETGLPVNLHANPRGGSRQIGVGVLGLEPRNQSLMTVANFPMGLMAELMSAVVFSGICDRHPGVRFVLEEAGVGWVPFMFWRFDREYDFGGPSTPVFKPDIRLSDKPSEFVRRQVFFTFEVEEEGGFRRVPEIGMGNFLWASDFPGLDSPWPHSKAEGHAPAEAALGTDALKQLVFENAVNLYKIPVTLPQH